MQPSTWGWRQRRATPSIMTRVLTSLPLLLLTIAALNTAAEELEVNPDFRSVTLHWGGPSAELEERIRGDASTPRTIVVTYCELQAWGPHRCKDKSVTASRAGRVFTAKLGGLRMATKYSFRVRPTSAQEEARVEPTSLPETSVTAQTKGFSARATLCLLNSTEVEVDTGPYFGGRISVETMNGPPGDIGPNPGTDSEDRNFYNRINHNHKWSACSVWGDPQSTRSTYRLRFDHEACGGTRALNRSAVATFVLVQESLPILTHSTRRFLVLCTAQPDTLTVSAGISLPSGAHAGGSDNRVNQGTGVAEAHRGARLLRNPSVPPVLLKPGDLQAQVQLPHNNARLAGSSGAQLVLMLALVSTVAVGSGFAAWWAIRRHRQLSAEEIVRNVDTCSTNAVTLSRSTSFSHDEDYEDDFSITTYDNFTAATQQGSESEASSVLRGDATSCSSFDTSSRSSGSLRGNPGDVQNDIRVFDANKLPEQPIYTTTIHIHDSDDIHQQSEA